MLKSFQEAQEANIIINGTSRPRNNMTVIHCRPLVGSIDNGKPILAWDHPTTPTGRVLR